MAESASGQTQPSPVSVVLVEGPGGVGKSRLVDEAVSMLPPEVTVARGSAFAGGGDVPLLPWADALRDLARQRGADHVARAAGSARGDFSVLLPELGTAALGGGQRIPDLLPWLLERLSDDGALVLVLEDLHAADPASIEVLLRIARHGRGRLTIVVTARPGGDARDPVGASRWVEVATDLRRLGAVTVVVRPLELAASEELAGHLVAQVNGGESASADGLADIVAGSSGVPFVLEQLVEAHIAGTTPEGLPGDTTVARLSALGGGSRDVLIALAVHGGEVDHDVLPLLLGWEESELLAALQDCVASGAVLAHPNGSYTVRHDLLGEQVKARLLPVELRRWHLAVAQALAQRPDDARAVAALPRHWQAAGENPSALVAAVKAGHASAYAPGVSARHFRRAADLWPTVPDAEQSTSTTYAELVELAATRAAAAGDIDAAVELARSWLSPENTAVDPARASRLSLLVASRGEWTLPAHEVDAAFAAAVRLAHAAGGANLAPALTGHARHLAALDRNKEAEPLARQALAVAGGVGAGPDAAYAGATLGSVLAHLGDMTGGVFSLKVALADLDPVTNAQEHARTAAELVWTEFYGGRASEALARALGTSEALSRAGLVRDVAASLLAVAAEIQVWRGHWNEAVALLERGSREDSAGLAATGRMASTGELALRRGDLSQARASYGAFLTHWDELGLRSFDHFGLVRAAEAAAADGDIAAALDLLAEGLTAVETVDTLYEIASFSRGACYVLASAVRVGWQPSVRLISQVDAVIARLAGSPQIDPATMVAAELLTAQAERSWVDGIPAAATWARAAAAWQALGYPWWELLCQLRHAEALLITRGARTSAHTQLISVRQRAAELGALHLVELADALAVRAGLGSVDVREQHRLAAPLAAKLSTDGREHAATLGFLTHREREVMDLLVQGLSNRSIAGRLFISEKTASVHVSNILAKLGVRSRLEAVAVARRPG
jgi:DNA-binding CsgD family transcriptional regulator/tetratricopeptide (TPR) repeat protein